MIVNIELLGYCMGAGAIYLLVIDLLWSKAERYVPTLDGFPKDLIEPKNLGWFVSCFIIQFVFFVLMPSIAYARFYTVIPFSGIRGGMAIGLFLVVFGLIPMALLIMFRLKLPAVFILYFMIGLFIKIIGSMSIIGYLYSL